MTEPTFADLFAEQQANELDWRGRRIHGLYELDVIPEELSIEFLRAATTPVQGIQVSLPGGELEVAGGTAANVVLWRDTAPSVVHLKVRRPGRRRRLQIWNVWRGPHDATMAWLGNSAIEVDVEDGSVVLRCSDGVGEPDFDDLHVRIRHV